MKLKGQYFSFDAIVASVMFILALFTLLSYWHSTRTALNSQTNDFAKEALRISDIMLTPGYPEGAACNSAAHKQLGLSMGWQDRRINKTKFDCAKTLTQTQLKDKFSTPFNVSVFVNNAPAIGSDITAVDADQIAKVRRIVTILNGLTNTEELATFDVYVYQ
ncbi:hypothetical protein J4450_00315 [Candidatus Micrarchaeota archaeon]|nr:hypothetical protein [Candidatus Micrarchaeota archaeon]